MRITGVVLAMLPCLAGPLWGDEVSWDVWLDGQVDVQVRVASGEGALVTCLDEGVVEFEATQSAYHMVVAVDPAGDMHLLFPRYWEDDGWVRRGSVQRVHPRDFATVGRPWAGHGVVSVEVIASPTPFDWERLGIQRSRQGCQWFDRGVPMHVVGDPYEAFNRLHRRLFPRWDQALFVVDDTWFFVGERCGVPTWVVPRRERVRRLSGTLRVGVRWEWEFGSRCARPVYRTAPRTVVRVVERPRATHRVVERQRDVVLHQPVVRRSTAEDPRVVRKRIESRTGRARQEDPKQRTRTRSGEEEVRRRIR